MKTNDGRPTLEWLVEQLGVHRTFDIVSALGGRRVYVPTSGKNGHGGIFLTSLTPAELKHFSKNWAGNYIIIPLARDFQIYYLRHTRRYTCTQIGSELKITEQGVSRALQRISFDYDFTLKSGEAS